MNDIAGILGITLTYSTPLIYTAMGGLISENSGVANIGLEGMMTIGAVVAATVGYYVQNPWIAFFCAGLAGMALALLYGIAIIQFGVDHVASGTAINLIGPGLSVSIVRIPFDGAAMTKPIPFDKKLPQLFSNTFEPTNPLSLIFKQYAIVYLAFILVAIVYIYLNKTRSGLRLRSVGEHPRVAETVGINVYKMKYIGVLIPGFLAGLGGASLSLVIVANFKETLVSGQGFIALAAVIFGGWKPIGALVACLLFGAAEGLVVYLGYSGYNIPLDSLNMLPYALTIIVLILFVGEANGPTANGKPYESQK